MYIRHLRVRNLKLLRDLEIDFTRGGEPRMWTVLIGENGLCKTTLLQAIALAASGATRAKLLANVPSLPDRRNRKARVEIEAEFGFSLEFHQDREYPQLDPKPAAPPYLWSQLQLLPGLSDFYGASGYGILPANPPSPDADAQGAQAVRSQFLGPLDVLSQARSEQLNLWFVTGYGVDRFLPEPRESKAPEDITVDRLRPLFGRGPIIGTGFLDLFRSLSEVPEVQWDDSAEGIEHSAGEDLGRSYIKILQQVFTAAGDPLLPRVRGIELRGQRGIRRARDLIESHRFDFIAGKNSIRVPATWLSQGYQGTIAWIADLVGQIFWEGNGPVAAEDMEGLVLLDEIDLHLHPAWQVGLVRALKKVFPRIQFVTTTHSPMILPYLRQDEVLVLGLDDEGSVVVQPADRPPALLTGSDIYADFFGLSEIFPHQLGEALWRYGYLARNPHRSEEEEEEILRLRRTLDEAEVDPGFEPVPRNLDT